MTAPSNIKILHIFNDPKFSKGFFEFLIRNKVSLQNHLLFQYRCNRSDCNSFGMESVFSKRFISVIPNLQMIPMLYKADKIIIHSLASPFLLFYLYFSPKLIRKTYWAIWGKDLYFYKMLEKKYFYHEIYEFFRKKVCKNIPHIIGFSKRDYELALKWYSSKADRYENFMYPSNCYKNIECLEKDSNTKVFLVGNSADPSNNHEASLSLLEKHKNDDIKIIAPLSYGNSSYAKKIKNKGEAIFGKKFIALTNLLPPDEYIKLLCEVDVGLFAHNRQQAMGNIITLLGMMKKVYIRKDITTWGTLTEMGITLFDITEFNINDSDHSNQLKENRTIIKNYFSEENLLDQWNRVFTDV